jgi:hypothetical protein
MFTSSSLREEGTEAIVIPSSSLVRRDHSIRLNAMFQAVQLPAGIAHLATRLAHVNRNALPHFVGVEQSVQQRARTTVLELNLKIENL